MNSIFANLYISFNHYNSTFFCCLVQEYQLNLQDPATPIMFGIHNLHNHILFFLCLILAAVLFLLFSILFFFSFYPDYYYSANYYRQIVLGSFYYIVISLFLLILDLFSKFYILFKVSRFQNLFSVRTKVFPSFFIKVFSFILFSVYAFFFNGIRFVRVDLFSLLKDAFFLVSHILVGFLRFFAAFFGIRVAELLPHSFLSGTHSFNISGSAVLKLRYSFLCLSSSFFSRFLIRLTLIAELVLFYAFYNNTPRVIGFYNYLNFNLSTLNYTAIASVDSLKPLCLWFFSSRDFVSLLLPFVFKMGSFLSSSKREWLTYLIVNKQYRVTHDLNLEIIWTIIPTIILIFIAVPSFALLYSMDELLDPTITIKIIGHQWYWSYEYTDFRPLCNQAVKFDSYMVSDSDLQIGDLRLLKTDCPLVLPKETNIRFLITSTDVLHSWAMPSFGIKMDAVPGRLNQTSAYIMESGRYYGQCSELCGVNHAFMPIEICVVDPKDYYNWMFIKLSSN